MKIKKVYGQEILDSRGWPTVACVLELEGGRRVCASVPSGASVGVHEAREWRDQDPKRFCGKGVLKALRHLETNIAPLLTDKQPDVIAMDRAMIALDGTPDKSRFGANALLAASIAVLRAQALDAGLELYDMINKLWDFEKPKLPVCMFNIVNGGMHARGGLSFQEFMIVPQYGNFSQNLERSVCFYAELKKLFEREGLQTAVGDEGGFSPGLSPGGTEREKLILQFLKEIIEQEVFASVRIALDVAASHFYDAQQKKYVMHEQVFDAQALVALYESLAKQYPIISIEDGLDEDDWDGWQLLTQQLGKQVQLVGDDIFVTNTDRIEQGVRRGVANAVLIKPNQIGTVSETIQAIQLCKKAGYKTVISHRSGETNDSFIADLAVGTAADQLKAGAPVRGERVAKYNRLLEIEKNFGLDLIKK